MITVVYSIRDRDPERLNNSIISLKKNSSVDFKINVVDYGSSWNFSREIIRICNFHNAKYIRTENQGLPWSRSHSLNIGVKEASTKFTVTTDIDMVFKGDILKESLKKYKTKSAIYCRPFWLSRSKLFSKIGDYAQLGGFQFIKRADFLFMGGFDERIKYWGREDFDFNLRLKNQGFKSIWLSESKMYHVWHPKSNSLTSDRPLSSMVDSNRAVIENVLLGDYKKNKIGKINTLRDRPILNLKSKIKPKIITIKKYELDIPKILKISKKQKYLILVFNERIRAKETKLYPLLVSFLSLIEKRIKSMGLELSLLKLNDFDLFYLSIDLLKSKGLLDYYIYDDYCKVELFFE